MKAATRPIRISIPMKPASREAGVIASGAPRSRGWRPCATAPPSAARSTRWPGAELIPQAEGRVGGDGRDTGLLRVIQVAKTRAPTGQTLTQAGVASRIHPGVSPLASHRRCDGRRSALLDDAAWPALDLGIPRWDIGVLVLTLFQLKTRARTGRLPDSTAADASGRSP